ncbi:MAG TPA: hypothetical protein IAC65_05760 [Candidatus Aphodousia faecipullorum]|nr:hypothetical protein [Candidatus Aphodousia faecipullorum]
MFVTKDASNIVDIPQSPLDDDLLGQSGYIAALSNFIKKAQTPMTIAVQGEWGCGKTSLMNAIAGQVCLNYQYLCPTDLTLNEIKETQKINRNCLGVWINTWQYSILKNDSDAQIAIIRGVARELSSQMDRLMGASSVVKETGRKLLNSISGIALTAAKVGVSAAGLNPLSLNGLDEMVRTQENGPEYFRNKLRQSVKMYLEEYNSKYKGSPARTIIFFIDDLDRLDPPVAVQVLSLLKNLFEVPECVFVLAIDYEVVVQGLASRFGARTEANEREFRSFFDKIIQLTFRVPIESYQVQSFLEQMLKKIKYVEEDELHKVDKAIFDFTLNSCGKNPRSIKRMLNTLSLTREIHRLHPTKLETENRELFLQLLFGVVCLQSAYPKLYDELVRRPNLYDWLDASVSNAESENEEQPPSTFEDEDISPQDFDLSAFVQVDPWIRKRQTAIQKLLFSIFSLVMHDKFDKFTESPDSYTDIASLRTTQDYLDQIIQTSHLTALEDESEDIFECSTLEDFIAHWSEKGIGESLFRELRFFCHAINKVFDNRLELIFSEDRVKFRAIRSDTKHGKTIATLQIVPDGLIIRVGRSYRIGVTQAKSIRSIQLSRKVDHVQDLTESDIAPIKDRFKVYMGVLRVPTRWEKVISDELNAAASEAPLF